MKSTTFRLSLVAVLVVCGVVVCGSNRVHAVTISSSSFSLGYGFQVAGWTTAETSGSNTATTIGTFSFVPTVNGAGSSGAGPTFPSRVLTTGNITNTSVGDAFNFNVSLAGSYLGTLPVDAINIQTQINVDDVRLRVTHRANTGQPNPGIRLLETTVGHTASSSLFSITSTGSNFTSLSTASFYTPVTWNPADYGITGFSSTRTFGVNTAVGVQYAIDGFEILGTVQVSYDLPIPEPSTCTLLFLAAPVASIISRRRRNSAQKKAIAG